MKILNWEEFNSCIIKITTACKGKKFTGVYGIPRGGLCLAVALSHSMNIPLLSELRNGCLIVDDVYETGKTLNQVLKMHNATTFVWVSKVTPTWWKAVEIAKPDEWLVFPWENRALAEADMRSYQLSRSSTT
tara:strand:+ start:5247 stop:5642 length:396 start_codon:yes stop_codon:yes gene_type:complete